MPAYAKTSAVLMAGALIAILAVSPATADEIADFYHSKQVQIVIGHEVGGGYDVYGRLVGRFLGNHLPGNPHIIPQNMVGAGSRKAANWLYSIAPRDGSVLGVTAQTTPLDQALKQEGVTFDASKFNWIGNPIVDNQVFFTWYTTGVVTMEDAITKGGLICGGTGAATNPQMLPKVIDFIAGTHIRMIPGYQGANNVLLAMERGELNCIGSHSWSTAKATVPDKLRDGKLNILVQWGPSKDPGISEVAKRDVPLMSEYAKNDMDRGLIKLMSSGMAIGRPIYAPPAVPAVRVAALRKAFDETMIDPAFLAAAEQSKADIRPMSGADLQTLVIDVVQTSPEVVSKMSEILKQ